MSKLALSKVFIDICDYTLGDFLPSFKCRDIGMDCPFEASAPSREELMAKITEHANKVHHLNPPPADLVEKIKKAIKK
jgi:predicted small metal-binding protein